MSEEQNIIKYVDFDLLSEPVDGAIERDWTGRDFEIFMSMYDEENSYISCVVLDVEKDIKPKGKKAKLGRRGNILFALPIGTKE